MCPWRSLCPEIYNCFQGAGRNLHEDWWDNKRYYIPKKKQKDQPSKIEQQVSEFDQDLPDDEERNEFPDENAEKESKDELSDAKQTFFQALKELKENLEKEPNIAPPEDQKAPSDAHGQTNENERREQRDPPKSKNIFASKSHDPGDEDEYWIGGKQQRDSADNVKMLMKTMHKI